MGSDIARKIRMHHSFAPSPLTGLISLLCARARARRELARACHNRTVI